MSETTSSREHEALVAAVGHVLKMRVAEATEITIKQATEAFEKRLRTEIGKAAIDVSRFYEIDSNRGVLTIRVKLDDFKA